MCVNLACKVSFFLFFFFSSFELVSVEKFRVGFRFLTLVRLDFFFFFSCKAGVESLS